MRKWKLNYSFRPKLKYFIFILAYNKQAQIKTFFFAHTIKTSNGEFSFNFQLLIFSASIVSFGILFGKPLRRPKIFFPGSLNFYYISWLYIIIIFKVQSADKLN